MQMTMSNEPLKEIDFVVLKREEMIALGFDFQKYNYRANIKYGDLLLQNWYVMAEFILAYFKDTDEVFIINTLDYPEMIIEPIIEFSAN